VIADAGYGVCGGHVIRRLAEGEAGSEPVTRVTAIRRTI
jgi:hypothetical protein